MPFFIWRTKMNPPPKHIIQIVNPADFQVNVLNERGEPVYQIHGREIIKSGVMRHERDLPGLSEYLRKRKVIPHDSEVIYDRRINGRVSEFQFNDLVSRACGGSGFAQH